MCAEPISCIYELISKGKDEAAHKSLLWAMRAPHASVEICFCHQNTGASRTHAVLTNANIQDQSSMPKFLNITARVYTRIDTRRNATVRTELTMAMIVDFRDS